MKKNEIDDLLRTISSKAKEEQAAYDYEGYAVLTDLKMTRDDLRKALAIMWDITMSMSKDERDDKYLFGKGLVKSKDIFMSQYQKPDINIPEEKVDKFRSKLENIKPLVDFLIKAKEVI